MSTITVKNYSKKIKKAQILNQVNLSLEKGKIYGIIGRNGSGKTMLLRALGRLIQPTSGTIDFNGVDLSNPDGISLRAGVVIEHAEMYPHLTGYENLEFLASIKKIITPQEIRMAMGRIGLDPEDPRTYKKYSLGMKQRLAIAQAIMERPDYLLFDEPTNALDGEGLELWRNIIEEEAQKGAIVVICSHDREEIQSLSDEIYTMHEGRLEKYVQA